MGDMEGGGMTGASTQYDGIKIACVPQYHVLTVIQSNGYICCVKKQERKYGVTKENVASCFLWDTVLYPTKIYKYCMVVRYFKI